MINYKGCSYRCGLYNLWVFIKQFIKIINKKIERWKIKNRLNH